MSRHGDRCAGTALDGGPCTFARAGHADGKPHEFVEPEPCRCPAADFERDGRGPARAEAPRAETQVIHGYAFPRFEQPEIGRKDLLEKESWEWKRRLYEFTFENCTHGMGEWRPEWAVCWRCAYAFVRAEMIGTDDATRIPGKRGRK